MVYTLILDCIDKIDHKGRVKKIFIKLEWMDPPCLLWKFGDISAVDNRLKVSLWTQSQADNGARFYPGVCRWIFRMITRVRFVLNELNIYTMELCERLVGEDKPIQHHFLQCTEYSNRGLIQFTPGVLRSSFSLWPERLYWYIFEEETRTMTACIQLISSSFHTDGFGAHLQQQSHTPAEVRKFVRFSKCTKA
jgi:hypothetical protein